MQIVTREHEKKQGLRRYFTGVCCKNGHISERSTANKKCTECRKAETLKNKEKTKK